MGTSAAGRICFGVHVGEYPPWFDEKSDFDGDVDSWWRNQTGFVHPGPELFTPDGAYIDEEGTTKKQLSEYFKHARDWDEVYLLPFALVNACSFDYSDYILAVPGTVRTAHSGDPEVFKPAELDVVRIPPPVLDRFTDFLKKYDIPDTPKWWLSSNED